jgi:TonB family protein
MTGAERLVHRTPVEYPAEARNKGIEGTVLIELALARDGTVEDATVIDGPAELRQAVLASVLRWHFSREALPRQRVSVQFSMAVPTASTPVMTRGDGVVGGVPIRQRDFMGGVPASTKRSIPDGSTGGLVGSVPAVPERGVTGDVPGGQPVPRGVMNGPLGVIGGTISTNPAPAELSRPEVLTMLSIRGLSPAATAELLQRLQLQQGQMIDNAAVQRARVVVREFDGRLAVTLAETEEGPRQQTPAVCARPESLSW